MTNQTHTATEAFTQALARQSWHLDFEQFCKIIDQPTEYGGQPNTYATDKWQSWHDLVRAAGQLGTFLPLLLETEEQPIG
jgi:hypothetical protein